MSSNRKTQMMFAMTNFSLTAVVWWRFWEQCRRTWSRLPVSEDSSKNGAVQQWSFLFRETLELEKYNKASNKSDFHLQLHSMYRKAGSKEGSPALPYAQTLWSQRIILQNLQFTINYEFSGLGTGAPIRTQPRLSVTVRRVSAHLFVIFKPAKRV